MGFEDFVWANMSRPQCLGDIVQKLSGPDKKKYAEARADFNGWTPLHYAARAEKDCHTRFFIPYLIEAGGELDAKSTKEFWANGIEDFVPAGSTPADVARICGTEDVFKQYCALARKPADQPEDPVDVRTLTVAELKEELRVRGLKLAGKKAKLVDRLQDAVDEEAERKEAASTAVAADHDGAEATAADKATERDGKASVVTAADPSTAPPEPKNANIVAAAKESLVRTASAAVEENDGTDPKKPRVA